MRECFTIAIDKFHQIRTGYPGKCAFRALKAIAIPVLGVLVPKKTIEEFKCLTSVTLQLLL